MSARVYKETWEQRFYETHRRAMRAETVAIYENERARDLEEALRGMLSAFGSIDCAEVSFARRILPSPSQSSTAPETESDA
jgi:hypothetical protein